MVHPTWVVVAGLFFKISSDEDYFLDGYSAFCVWGVFNFFCAMCLFLQQNFMRFSEKHISEAVCILFCKVTFTLTG